MIASRPVELPGALLFDDGLASPPMPIVEREEDDLAVLIFTSGTAGAPKAAMLTHGNLLANLQQCQDHPGRAQMADDVAFGVLPFFHIFGLNVVLGLSLLAGATTLAIERFDPQSGLEAIRNHGVTVISGAPTMWSAWAALPGAPADAFATVRLATSGAAARPGGARAAAHRFGLEVTEGYGLTEASPVVSWGRARRARRQHRRAPARPLGPPRRPRRAGRARRRRGRDLGEGPERLPRLLGRPGGHRRPLTPDGWLRTGDVAVIDDDGFLFLVDRAKDLIIVSGFNVYPAEVEEVIVAHPAVARCRGGGRAPPALGEAVKAFVVLAPAPHLEEDDIVAHSRPTWPGTSARRR